MFEQTFKNVDDILHKDAGCGSELDYVEQTSWILFLKYLDDLEKDAPQQPSSPVRLTRPSSTKTTNGLFGPCLKIKTGNWIITRR